MQNDSRMSEKLENITCALSMSSAEDSPARMSPRRILMASDSPANEAAFSTRPCAWLANLDQDSSCWRTWQTCFDGALEQFSQDWPRSGMTQSGSAFQRMPWAPLTSATGCGYLPTPNAQDFQPICWGRAERLVRGLRGRERSGTAGGCMNLQDSMAAGWMLRQKLESRPPRGSMPRVNPCYWEFLMGYPAGWTEQEPSETP